MARVVVNDAYLTDIADAIREKLNTEDTYKPSEMADAIESISGGSSLGTKSITANGTYNASSDSLDGYSQVTVNVPQGVTPTGTKQISITQNGTTTEDVTNYASAEITVNVSGGSGQCVLLDTFTLNGVNSLRVDIGSDWSNYDVFLLVPNITFSESDWLYLSVDTTSGGRYAGEITAVGTDMAIYIYKNNGNYNVFWIATKTNDQFSSYLYIRLYRPTKTMTGTWKLYGMKA